MPGKSQFIAITGVIGTGVSGAVVDTYYGDANNGIFFRQNGNTNLQLALRSSGVTGSPAETVVNQADWSFDGFNTGLNSKNPSGKTLDITKSFILLIDLQFLGMGRVRVWFDIDGVPFLAHEFKNANNLALPYMQTASLPVGMLVTSTGGSKTAYFKCASVISEGGSVTDYGNPIATPEVTVTAGNGVRTFAVAVRPKTTFNSLPNRALVVLECLDICVTGNSAIKWEIALGATFSVQPTFTDINTTYSGLEYGTGGTFTNISNGLVIASGYIDNSTSSRIKFDDTFSLRIPLALNRAGAQRAMGTYYLFFTGLTGNSATRENISFMEIR